MAKATRLQVLGQACDEEGNRINTRQFGLRPIGATKSTAEVILVVGSSMNSGKTTTVGSAARALSRSGCRVAAAKVTGTAAGKDLRFFRSSAANPVLDFTHAGLPSTYMLDREDLLRTYRTLLDHLHALATNYILVEVADGLVQRETRMLLEDKRFAASVDHVLFAGCDSLSAQAGTRFLQDAGLPVRAVTGALTQSELAMREAREVTQLPCLSTDAMLEGELLELLRGPSRPQVEAADSSLPTWLHERREVVEARHGIA